MEDVQTVKNGHDESGGNEQYCCHFEPSPRGPVIWGSLATDEVRQTVISTGTTVMTLNGYSISCIEHSRGITMRLSGTVTFDYEGGYY